MQKLFIFIGSIAGLCLPFIASAVNIHFVAPDTTAVGSDVAVSVVLDPAGEPINALQGIIKIEGGKFLVSDIYTGDSIVSWWTIEPTRQRLSDSSTQVNFAGMIPGGFVGIHEVGSDELKPGTIMTLLVRLQATGTLSMTVSDFSVHRHDGMGTEIESAVIPDSIQVVASNGEIRNPIALEDTEPPQLIEFKIITEPMLFDGTPTLLLTTSDAGTGVLSIEAKVNDGKYQVIKSPHPFPQLKPGDVVDIKVVDKAGNVTNEQLLYRPAAEKISTQSNQTFRLLMVLSGAIVLGWIIRRYLRI